MTNSSYRQYTKTQRCKNFKVTKLHYFVLIYSRLLFIVIYVMLNMIWKMFFQPFDCFEQNTSSTLVHRMKTPFIRLISSFFLKTLEVVLRRMITVLSKTWKGLRWSSKFSYILYEKQIRHMCVLLLHQQGIILRP